ncbi:MAG: 2-iminobutanoate/2-iminopropanoate deaminase [Cryomorphaceae bacterium]|nr:MAG: 2-iminobutanoate/2-iminopropanoate deaminase [Cryomorphaceae bacterium]
MKKIINTPNAPTVIGPYSQAILSGNTLYCSGLIAINPITGNLVTDNISAETKQVMKNILAVLKAAEMNFENVVKCTIFMKDMNDYASINEVYGNSFDSNLPAREAVQVSVLPKNVNVEISVIAVK